MRGHTIIVQARNNTNQYRRDYSHHFVEQLKPLFILC